MSAAEPVVCPICPRHCALLEGQTGFCAARSNVGGVISCNNYGRLTAMALDPVEKKPLAHFHPGGQILSVGSYGCNLACPFCQNASISRANAATETVFVGPEALAARAAELVAAGNIGVAYTYNEPLVGYEYVQDCARQVHARGLLNVLVTNGMICEEPLAELLPQIDAMNIDLKGFSQRYYDWVGGRLETVKQTIRSAATRCHVEVTTLIVPGENDSEEEMDALAAFLADVSPELPLHVTRFFPRHRLTDRPPTPPETILRLRDVAAARLRYVYAGNFLSFPVKRKETKKST